MKQLFLAVLLITGFQLMSQEKSNLLKPRLYTGFEAGLLSGSHASSFSLQGKAGLRVNKTYVGAGAGLDGYRFRSVPVFLDVQQELGNKEQRFFLYANGGYHFPWVSNNNRKMEGDFYSDFDGGSYIDGGIGLKFWFGDKRALTFTGGYSRKNMRKVYMGMTCPWGGCYNTIEQYDYRFSRIVFRAGWQF